SYNGAAYSPDGQSIYASTARDLSTHPDRVNENRIVQIRRGDLSQKTILEQKETAFRGFSVSPSGKKAATLITATGGLSYGRLALLNSDGTGLKFIDFDRTPSNFNWSPDEKTLWFTAQSNGGSPVFKLDVRSGKVSRITDFDTGIAQ